MTTHQEFQNLIPALALDCLEDDEAVLVAEHVAGCSTCQAELAEYRRTVNQLVLAAPPAIPSMQLQRRLAERIKPKPDAPSPTPAGWWHTLLTGLKRSAPVWGAVALLLVVGLALGNWRLWQQSPRSMRVVSLVNTQAAPTASGLIVVSSDGEYGAMVVENLPELSPDRQYQLWLIKNGQRTSGAVFSVGEHGYRSVQVEAPLPLDQYEAFGITIEPAGGSPGPTGEKVLGSEF